jgi:hypothetical protein
MIGLYISMFVFLDKVKESSPATGMQVLRGRGSIAPTNS